MNKPLNPARPAMRRRDYLSAVTIAACMFALILPYLMPVVILDRAEGVQRLPGGEVRAHLSGLKVRACPPLEGSFVGWALTPDGWREVGFEWVDDLSPDSPRPAGVIRQQFGPARWSGVSRAATMVRVTVQHTCGGRRPFVTVIGPFPVAPG